MKFHLVTHGCQMNAHETEILAGLLEEAAWEPAAGPEDADLIVLVTCAVRDSAERRARGKLGELKRWKQARPGRLLAVGGCVPQQPEVADSLAEDFPHVDVVFGPANLARLPVLLEEARRGGRAVEILAAPADTPDSLPVRRGEGVRAWVTIMHGCDHFCAYCIVPYVRGRERSRPPAAILAELEQLAGQGFREAVLLGQNVNNYGRDGDDIDFGELLERADGITGLARIRFTTSHPANFAARFLAVMARATRVCEHLHLPVQSGSDRILAAMRRGYTQSGYLELLARARRALPGVSITTDIIVGFPGETDGDFAQTLQLVEEARFDAAFTFLYSDRRGTLAASLEGKLPLAVRKERLAQLNDVQNRIGLEINRSLVGQRREILVEGSSAKNPHRLAGRTRTNKLVTFSADRQAGDLVTVKITGAHTWTLEGLAEE
ncbi:MAG: tRNA (N6-isopentenyl adenosine(37)-C2)-methylthiotransferase MiaB [bacterium]|nr:tRNA (N6-isopentenyl adenosine(37)-C2)-methylthiotransferase MiaB [bacterium]